MNTLTVHDVPESSLPADYYSALAFIDSGAIRHVGYVYPVECPEIPVGKRVRIVVEYEDDSDET